MSELKILRDGGKWNWFSNLSDEAFAELATYCEYQRFSPGSNIYHQGDKAVALYQVITGRVLMRTYSPEGKELLYVYMEPGDCFGELGLIDGKGCHHDADAGPETTLMCLPKDRFQSLRRRYSDINDSLLQLLARRTRSVYATIEDAFLLDMSHRLARRLTDLFRQRLHRGDEPVVTCSHEELANMIGSSRQSVSTLLKTWEKNGLLEQSYGQITLLDTEALESLIET